MKTMGKELRFPGACLLFRRAVITIIAANRLAKLPN